MKLLLTGQTNLLEETSGAEKIYGFDHTELDTLTGLEKHIANRGKIIAGDGVVVISIDGITAVKAFILKVTGPGSVTLKNNGNSNGMDVSTYLLLIGELASITIETVSTQELSYEYLAVG